MSNQNITLRLLNVYPVKHIDGRVVSILHLQDNVSAQEMKVEFPYNRDYTTLDVQSLLSGTYSNVLGGTVNIDFPNKHELFALDRTQVCPYCGSVLISKEEVACSDLYCFNPFCSCDPYQQLFHIAYRIGFTLTEQEADICQRLSAVSGTQMPNFLLVLNTLYNLRTTSFNNSVQAFDNPILESLFKKLDLHIGTGATVSSFLKLLGVPSNYDDDMVNLDVVFSKEIENFYIEMMNYRSMSVRLPMYDNNFMNLVYSNLQINKNYIDLYFRLRQMLVR